MIDIHIPPNELVGYIWNAADWQKIREEFRIVGLLCGSLSNYPRQDTYFNLPMCLAPEEITLLKEKRLARLVQCPCLLERPSDEIRKRFAEDEVTFKETQKQSYLQRKELEVRRSLENIMKGKRKEGIDECTNLVDPKKMISQEVDKIQSMSIGNYVNTPLGDPWIDEARCMSVDWVYPNSDEQRLKYDVFKDLWERNYCITSGAKFGGDFLCYLGDPVKFHASFIVVCKDMDSDISCVDLIVAGRIGSYTKKTLVFASRLNNSIVYESLQWFGNPKQEMHSLPSRTPNESEGGDDRQ